MRSQIKLFCAMFCLLFATNGIAMADSMNDRAPTLAQLAAIAGWISANSNLPYAEDLPRVELVPPAQLLHIRYKHLLPGRWRTIGGEYPSQAIGGEHSTPRPQFQRDVVAVYDDTTETIYLPENWTGVSRAEQSVLVHEMVHHLQNRARMVFACAGVREKPAYLAQKQWLEMHGLDLEQEFQVDMFTIVAMSACME